MRGYSAKSILQASCVVVLSVLLSGCVANRFNPFNKMGEKLPGARTSLIFADSVSPVDGINIMAPPLPAPVMNDAWSQSGVNAANAPGNLALNVMPQQITVIGGAVGRTSNDLRLSSSPIIYNDTIFILDTEANLVSFPVTGGSSSILPLRPVDEDNVISGGGLAINQGILYVVTGYGDIYAIDPVSYEFIWHVDLGVPIRSAPTIAGDKVFIMTKDSNLIVLNIIDGHREWSYRSVEAVTGLLSAPNPAVSGDIVVAPYPSGEIVALHTLSGQLYWEEALFRARHLSRYGSISDIAARPVIYDGIVYALSVSGRMSAVRLKTGEPVWRQNISGSQMPIVVGQTVYVVDMDGMLIALDRLDGHVYWMTRLDGQEGIQWSGPILADGYLWLVSSTGFLANIDARSGQIISYLDLGAPSYTAPLVVGGRMYVMTGQGAIQLLD